MDKPIEELFPEMLERYPQGTKWADLRPGTRAAEMKDLLAKQQGIAVHINSQTEPEVIARLPELVEWSLRHGKPHPELPWTSAKLKNDPGILLD